MNVRHEIYCEEFKSLFCFFDGEVQSSIVLIHHNAWTAPCSVKTRSKADTRRQQRQRCYPRQWYQYFCWKTSFDGNTVHLRLNLIRGFQAWSPITWNMHPEDKLFRCEMFFVFSFLSIKGRGRISHRLGYRVCAIYRNAAEGKHPSGKGGWKRCGYPCGVHDYHQSIR